MRTAKEFFEYYHEARWHLKGTYAERAEAEAKMFSDWYHEMEPGEHAHVVMYSDIYPVTIIKKTATTLTVRRDKATRDPNWKPEWIVGGFAGHCTNNDEQQWIIEEDPDGGIETFRWSKRYNQYRDKGGCKLFPHWKKHYDYNF